MRTVKEVKEMIKKVKSDNSHVLTGEIATIQINAPRALMQLSAESRLEILYWVLGRQFKTKLKWKGFK